MKKTNLFILIMSVAALSFNSCSKESDIDPRQDYRLPSSANRGSIVIVPAGLQTLAENQDFYAMTAISYMLTVNMLSSFSEMFTLPEDAKLQNKKSDSNIYYWSMGGYSYWMTYSVLADKYIWKYEYQFPDVPRFTYIYAEENKSGKQGLWTINSPNDLNLKLWNYVWNIDALENFQAVIKLNDNGITNEGQFEVGSNSNNSGSFIYKIGTLIQAEVIWNSDGSGSYLIQDGNEEKTGFWN